MKNKLSITGATLALFLFLQAGPALAQALVWHYGAVSIAAAELLPRKNSITYDTNGVRMATSDTGTVGFLAPVELPQYSYITKMTLEAHDPAGGEIGGYVKAMLLEYRFNTVLVLATANTGIPNAPGDVRVPINLAHLTNNLEYSYGIGVEINNGNAGAWGEMYYKVIIEFMYPEL